MLRLEEEMADINEYGRHWKPQVPRNDVKIYLRRTHVSTPFEEIECELRQRMKSSSGFTHELTEQTIEYARIVHAEHVKLYNFVQRGC